MTVKKNIFDIAIIGGGPVGIFSFFYANLRSANSVLIESLPELGGQVNAFYPQKEILDVAGFNKVNGNQLVENLTNQLGQFQDLKIKNNTTITQLEKTDDYFELSSETEKFYAKTVILAIGKGDFKPRQLQLPNIDQLSKVTYFLDSLDTYQGKTVAIAGGGDVALETALQVSQFASQTYLIHRSDHFSALESTVEKVNHSTIKQLTSTKIETLSEDDTKLIIKTNAEQLEVDQLIVNYGLISDNKILESWNLNFQYQDHLLQTNSKQATSIEGIFAVGDISNYPGKAELIATGFGEAMTAINSAIELYQPQAGGPVHSTVQKFKDGKIDRA